MVSYAAAQHVANLVRAAESLAIVAFPHFPVRTEEAAPPGFAERAVCSLVSLYAQRCVAYPHDFDSGGTSVREFVTTTS